MKKAMVTLTVATAAAALVAVYLVRYARAYLSGDPTNNPAQSGQLNTIMDDLVTTLTPTGSVDVATNVADANQAAFLDMIGTSEGADYNTLYGGGTFADYSTHPNQAITAGGWTSTAAGKYQILYKTWLYLCAKLGVSDFSPETQDRMALELISEKAALEDVQAGRFASAVAKCAKTWASLPGSPYGQPTHSLETLTAAYINAGGTVATA